MKKGIAKQLPGKMPLAIVEPLTRDIWKSDPDYDAYARVKRYCGQQHKWDRRGADAAYYGAVPNERERELRAGPVLGSMFSEADAKALQKALPPMAFQPYGGLQEHIWHALQTFYGEVQAAYDKLRERVNTELDEIEITLPMIAKRGNTGHGD